MNKASKKITCPDTTAIIFLNFEKTKKEIKNINVKNVKSNLHHQLKNIDLSHSGKCHIDETVVFINRKRYYLQLIIDSKNLLIISYHFSPY